MRKKQSRQRAGQETLAVAGYLRFYLFLNDSTGDPQAVPVDRSEVGLTEEMQGFFGLDCGGNRPSQRGRNQTAAGLPVPGPEQ